MWRFIAYTPNADFVVALADLFLKDLFVSTSKNARTIESARAARKRSPRFFWLTCIPADDYYGSIWIVIALSRNFHERF